VFANILVGLDGSPSSERALEHAIDLARAGDGKLTLMTVAPPTYVTLGGVSIETVSAELDKWATNLLDEAARAVPANVTADNRLTNRPPRRNTEGEKWLEQVMELAGLEPATSWVRSRRSPN
jgi:nucleotide-binding universal stress UspA family protein